jgi:hypothetical protein
MTTLQELIKDFTELSKKEGDSGFVGRSVLAIIKNKGYLEKEKQQIIEAHAVGRIKEVSGVKTDGYDYYEKLSAEAGI